MLDSSELAPPQLLTLAPLEAREPGLRTGGLRHRFGRLRAFSEALRRLGLAGDSTPAGLALLTGEFDH